MSLDTGRKTPNIISITYDSNLLTYAGLDIAGFIWIYNGDGNWSRS